MVHGATPDMQRDMVLLYQRWKADLALQRRLFLMWWDPLAQPIGGQDPFVGNWGSVGVKFITACQKTMSFSGSHMLFTFSHQSKTLSPLTPSTRLPTKNFWT